MAVARHMYRLDTEIELLGYKQGREVVLDNHYELIISLKGACDKGAIARKYFNWGEPERVPHSQYNGRNVYIYICIYICNRTSFRIYAYFCNLTYTVQIFLTFHVIAAKTTRTSSPASKETRAAQIIG